MFNPFLSAMPLLSAIWRKVFSFSRAFRGHWFFLSIHDRLYFHGIFMIFRWCSNSDRQWYCCCLFKLSYFTPKSPNKQKKNKFENMSKFDAEKFSEFFMQKFDTICWIRFNNPPIEEFAVKKHQKLINFGRKIINLFNELARD